MTEANRPVAGRKQEERREPAEKKQPAQLNRRPDARTYPRSRRPPV